MDNLGSAQDFARELPGRCIGVVGLQRTGLAVARELRRRGATVVGVDEKTEAELDLRGTPHQGFTRSYVSLCGPSSDWTARHFDPSLAANHLVPRFVQRNQIQVTPAGGVYGARGSRLMQVLLDGHEDVRLSSDEIRRLAAWIDMNAIFYGVYDAVGQARQFTGGRVPMPELQ